MFIVKLIFLHLLGCGCDPVVKYGSVCEQILLANGSVRKEDSGGLGR
jgi:hypothetical protein